MSISGARDRVNVRFFDGLGVVVRERMTDHLGSDRLGTEANLEEAARHFPRPEAGTATSFWSRRIVSVDCASKFLLVYLDGELDAVALKGLRSRSHRSCVLYWRRD